MPASRTRRDSRKSGAGAVRRSGRSAWRTTSGKTVAMSAAVTVTSWCSLPNVATIIRWYADSSYSGSSKRIEKVWSRPPIARRPSAATSELSRPPER